jgi:hypothetical protein
MSFANLKKNRSQSLEKLSSQLDKITQTGYSDPLKEKYWSVARDSVGNGFAIIRFLPAPKGEDMPFQRIWDHGFQNKANGRWYIEKSLTTIGQDDPVSKYNTQLWNTGLESDKEIARNQKRRLKYHANILVIKDGANPENEGKVFLFAFGKKIFDKLNDLMNPEFEDETPINPFDFWDGANFKLKIRQDGKYPSFDKSEFDNPTKLFDGDEGKLEEIYDGLNPLQELVAADQFKSYAELETKLHSVLGISDSGTSKSNEGRTAEDITDDVLDMTKVEKSRKSADMPEASAKSEKVDDDDDADLAFFQNLANE